MEKNLVVTSALPYANGQIHLGHIASTYLPADIFTRFVRLTGRLIYHICATDDYGTPILIKAEKEGKTPEEYVREWNERDKKDFESVGINFDYFSKTSSPQNIKFVQDVFMKLYKNNHIKEEIVVQFFCTFDNKYLPDRYVIGRCPFCKSENQYSDLCESCGRVPEQILDPQCVLCGRPPVKKESLHYFFKLSDFDKSLKIWLSDNKNLQEDVVKYVLNWITAGLQDWDITRDLTWGVPIPKIEGFQNYEDKVFYGWFDNHLCYISSFNTFAEAILKKDGRKLWNDSEIIHYIGKDIIYHHYLFLPAIRLGIKSEYKLPDRIVTRGHLLFQNRKLSKSKNWSITLGGFTKSFDPDYLRFYFSTIIPYSQSDINFDWDSFYEKINNELISNIGNFINRTLSFTKKQFDGKIPPRTILDSVDKQALIEITQIAYIVGELIFGNEIDKAMKRILQFSTFFNQYFQSKEPWKSRQESNNSIWISANAVRSIAILLFPFIPTSAQKIWKQLGISENLSDQDWYSASELRIPNDHNIGNDIIPIFKRIERTEIEDQKTGFLDTGITRAKT
ncbi:methionine--tRNA ligase [Candidatus Nitrosocosmicus arcticus]|uniref:methionine--tRNA ligase n=1 Tax=Candidatus Nitrosocosmicus arcticus TaxID=2035267 RepID=UPI0011A4A513